MEDQTGSRLTYAEKEGVERSKERRNGGRAIGGRGKIWRSGVGGIDGGLYEGEGRDTMGRRWEGEGG